MSDVSSITDYASKIVDGVEAQYRFKTGKSDSLRLLKSINLILEYNDHDPVANPISDFVNADGLMWNNYGIGQLEESASGAAVAGQLATKGEVDPKTDDRADVDFVVKFHRNSHSTKARVRNFADQEMEHEYNIGLIINILRAVCPNFAMVLGKFECSADWSEVKDSRSGAVISIDNIDFCGGPAGADKTKFLIYESVKSPMDLRKYLISCLEMRSHPVFEFNSRNGLTAVYQALAAASLAEDAIGMYHQDEHFANILVSPLAANGSVSGTDVFTYILKGKTISFETDVLVSFIDYGRTVIQRPGFPAGCQEAAKTWPNPGAGYGNVICGGAGMPNFGKCQFMWSLVHAVNVVQPTDNLGQAIVDVLGQYTITGLSETNRILSFRSGLVNLGRILKKDKFGSGEFNQLIQSDYFTGKSIFFFYRYVHLIETQNLREKALEIMNKYMMHVYGVDYIALSYMEILDHIHKSIMNRLTDITREQQDFLGIPEEDKVQWSSLYTEDEVEDIVLKTDNPKIFTFERWFADLLNDYGESGDMEDNLLGVNSPIGGDYMLGFFTYHLFNTHGVKSYVDKILNSSNLFMCYTNFVFQYIPNGPTDSILLDNDLIESNLVNAFDPEDCSINNLDDFEKEYYLNELVYDGGWGPAVIPMNPEESNSNQNLGSMSDFNF